VSQIEAVAQQFLRKHWDKREPYVPIEAIIEDRLEIMIDFVHHDDINFIGSIGRLSDGRWMIVVDADLVDTNPNRYRFTLAQELIHLLLHRSVLEAIETWEEAQQFMASLTEKDYSHRIEGPANKCAAAISMPQREFHDEAYLSYQRWYEKVEAAAVIVPEFIQKRVVDDLARHFRVSAPSAKIRLQNWPIRLYEAITDCAAKHLPFLSSPD
jgi:hypothetical protein